MAIERDKKKKGRPRGKDPRLTRRISTKFYRPNVPGIAEKTTKRLVRKAIPGTYGVVARIARRLGVPWSALHVRLRRPDWEDIRQALIKERNRVSELAETAVTDLIKQNKDLGEKGKNARWYLDRKVPDYKPKKELTHEGGVNPIRRESTVNLAALNLPLDTRRELLKRIQENALFVQEATGQLPVQASRRQKTEEQKIANLRGHNKKRLPVLVLKRITE